MNEILRFLIRHCDFLYERHGFKFADSLVSDSFGGDAYLVLATPILCIRFVKDRDQFFVEVRSPLDRKRANWVSFDIVQRFITGADFGNAFMNEANANFLAGHIEEIIAAFEKPRLQVTLKRLSELENVRAKEMFG